MHSSFVDFSVVQVISLQEELIAGLDLSSKTDRRHSLRGLLVLVGERPLAVQSPQSRSLQAEDK